MANGLFSFLGFIALVLREKLLQNAYLNIFSTRFLHPGCSYGGGLAQLTRVIGLIKLLLRL